MKTLLLGLAVLGQPDYRPVQAPGYPPGWTIAPPVLSPQEVARRSAPYGGDGPVAFVALLNAERAKYGIPPVSLDRRFEGEAFEPHYCSSSIRSYVASLDAWLHSPLHRAALMRPDIRVVAIVLDGRGTAATARGFDRGGRLAYPSWREPRTPQFLAAMAGFGNF